MSSQTLMPTANIEELVEQILVSRKISRADQQHLMSTLMSKDDLDEKDRRLIDKVFNSVRQGLVRAI